MQNLLQHSEDINADFAALYFAQYMQGEWGVQVGYIPTPMYIANMQKTLLDYQELGAADCHYELFIASQGSISFDCCTSGSTRMIGSTQTNCCPVGYTYNSTSGTCQSITNPSTTTGTITCPCCPPGYTYLSPYGICQGATASDTVDPIECQPYCQDPSGKVTSLIACNEVVPDSNILIYPVAGTSPFPQLDGLPVCTIPVTLPVIPVVTPIVPQGVIFSINQFTVDVSVGPVSGTSIWVPYAGGVAYLIGKTIKIALGTLLTDASDYSFDISTGTITLLLGRQFNPGEVYTIFAY